MTEHIRSAYSRRYARRRLRLLRLVAAITLIGVGVESHQYVERRPQARDTQTITLHGAGDFLGDVAAGALIWFLAAAFGLVVVFAAVFGIASAF